MSLSKKALSMTRAEKKRYREGPPDHDWDHVQQIANAIDWDIICPMDIFDDLLEILSEVMIRFPEGREEFAEKLECLRSDMLVAAAKHLRETSPDLN
jgi:hypothetical protein